MRAARIWEHVRSNVIGYVCLVWLMTGTAFAATQLPAHSVGHKQLRKGAVGNRALARRAVTASKVKPGSLTAKQIKPGSLTGKQVKADSLTGGQILESSLGTVPRATSAGDADQLGGAVASAYQRRVTGTCAATSAIREVGADGSVTCQPVGTVTKVTAGTGLTQDTATGDINLGTDLSVLQHRVTNTCATAITSIGPDGTVNCSTARVQAISESLPTGHGQNFGNFGDMSLSLSCGTAGHPRILIFNETGSPATLNWVFWDGTKTVASGTSLGTVSADNIALFDATGDRIEGQFILAGPSSVTTANLHAFSSADFCEMAGTTEKAGL